MKLRIFRMLSMLLVLSFFVSINRATIVSAEENEPNSEETTFKQPRWFDYDTYTNYTYVWDAKDNRGCVNGSVTIQYNSGTNQWKLYSRFVSSNATIKSTSPAVGQQVGSTVTIKGNCQINASSVVAYSLTIYL